MKANYDPKQIFRERLKDLMDEKKLNNDSLSKEINIPRTTINGWTLGKVKIQIDALCIVADYFKVSTDYLLGRED